MIPASVRRTGAWRAIARWRRRRLIASSSWFDEAFYRSTVAEAGDDPLGHFVRVGESVGLDPHPDFDTDAYVLLNPGAEGQALTHFVRTVAANPSRSLQPWQVIDPADPRVASGWFDAEWYRSQLDDGSETADDALARWHPYVHYVRHGVTDGRPPSPIFDADEYVEHHDVGTEGPVRHWIDEQPEVGPFATLRTAQLDGLRPYGRHRVRPDRDLDGRSVCVMVHGFYPDVLPALFERLRALPSGWTLLVSVVDEAAANVAQAAVDAAFEQGVGPGRTVVRVVANRGRNFAPLLVEFGDEVLTHEFVLHLHTKKSLYTGNEATEWRDHLVDHLVPDPAGVSAILSAFADDPTTGVVQAPAFPALPVWANHWLANSGRGRQLLERMGLDPALGRGYVDYPVGGMFWARSAALRPLYDLGLTLDDFEPEAGQTDRTLAHTLERLVSWSAVAAGLQYVEFDADTGTWRRGWTTRSSDRIGRIGRAEIADALRGADLVTIDLFDTLLLRPALDAEALRETAAQRLGDEGLDLLRRRIEAEVEARGHGLGDSTLGEIYAVAAERWPDDADAFDRLREAELELERRTIVPRRWLIETLADLKSEGQRFVLVTDTFFERPFVEELVEAVGATDLLDDLVVSNDVRARKDTGDVWDLVAEREHPERWVHIGDNEFSDIQQAADRGIGTLYLPHAGAIASAAGFDLGAVAAPARRATSIVAGAGLASLMSVRPDRDAARTPAEFGYGVVGPLMVSFVSWIRRRAIADAVDRLLFVARDGYLPHRIMQQFDRVDPDRRVAASYFLTSRRAALRVALGSDDPEIAIDAALGASWFDGTVSAFFDARFGWTPEPDVFDGMADRVVDLPRDEPIVRDIVRAVLDELTAIGGRERAAFDHYVSSLGIGADGHHAMVDLGYSGTTQRLLETALPGRTSGYYAVLTPAGTATPATAACFGDDAVWNDANLILNHQRIFELVCAAPHGQVAGLGGDGTSVGVMIDSRAQVGEDERLVVAEVQAAAIRFCADLIERHGPDLLSAPLDEPAVMRAIERAGEIIVPSFEAVFAGLHLDDDYSGIPRLPIEVD
ncbi:MAG: rhamnan synthesis F family protein [Ilumatobacter fluminis]|uniref:rhamnan synthesis F family protein n=1 Tax=Ilumatobacter fluminis TaxID=467091 RepID=UPI0032EF49C5